jgi:hypothetical protein
MAQVPNKVATRLAAGLKRFQPILQAARSRDVNESDTVVIVMDMLQEIFGYDKYAEITSEHLIRGTFCDLAIKLEGGLQMLIEVKAIGLELKDSFLKQAVDYAANQGTEWVVLTNGVRWRAYKVIFGKPIESTSWCSISTSPTSTRETRITSSYFGCSRRKVGRKPAWVSITPSARRSAGSSWVRSYRLILCSMSSGASCGGSPQASKSRPTRSSRS